MSQLTFTTDLTIAELETSFSIYYKSLRILILEEKTINQIRRSVCWRRLSSLHEALPYRYPRFQESCHPSDQYIRGLEDMTNAPIQRGR